MKTRTQRLTELAERMDANASDNRIQWGLQHGTGSVVKEVMEDIELHLAVFGECDPPEQEHYLAGPNFDRGLVMYCITGDDNWLPDHRCDPHITF